MGELLILGLAVAIVFALAAGMSCLLESRR